MNIMNEQEFLQYHKKPTHTIKKILKIASHLFYISICTDACWPPYNTHQQLYTLLPEIANRPNQNFYHNPLPENNPIAAIQESPKPPKRMQNYKTTPSPLSQIQNNPKEKTNLAQSNCLHHINAHGLNPKTKTIQCGCPPTKYSHTINQILSITIYLY
jgi:hypothetical protein